MHRLLHGVRRAEEELSSRGGFRVGLFWYELPIASKVYSKEIRIEFESLEEATEVMNEINELKDEQYEIFMKLKHEHENEL